MSRSLLAAIAAVPAGEKLPLSRLAREWNCSPSVMIGNIERLVASGGLDAKTLRPPESVQVGTLPTNGSALFAVLVGIAMSRSLSIQAASLQIFGNKARIYSLRDAADVRPGTLQRCQAWLDSSERGLPHAKQLAQVPAAPPVPKAEVAALAPPQPSAWARRRANRQDHVADRREVLETACDLSLEARTTRRHGETIAERMKRIAAEIDAEEREVAQERRDEELEALDTPSSVLRRAQRDWPDQCARVRSLAGELGVQLGETWRRVIAAGVETLSDPEAA